MLLTAAVLLPLLPKLALAAPAPHPDPAPIDKLAFLVPVRNAGAPTQATTTDWAYPAVTASPASLPLGAACSPADPDQCANGARCWASNKDQPFTCGGYNAPCESDSQCSHYTCLAVPGPGPSSTVKLCVGYRSPAQPSQLDTASGAPAPAASASSTPQAQPANTDQSQTQSQPQAQPQTDNAAGSSSGSSVTGSDPAQVPAADQGPSTPSPSAGDGSPASQADAGSNAAAPDAQSQAGAAGSAPAPAQSPSGASAGNDVAPSRASIMITTTGTDGQVQTMAVLGQPEADVIDNSTLPVVATLTSGEKRPTASVSAGASASASSRISTASIPAQSAAAQNSSAHSYSVNTHILALPFFFFILCSIVL